MFVVIVGLAASGIVEGRASVPMWRSRTKLTGNTMAAAVVYDGHPALLLPGR
jgi:hypothetical protein